MQTLSLHPPMAAHAERTLEKVPALTLTFWFLKVLLTTVGEGAADFANERMHLGLARAGLLLGALLVVALVLQLRARRYHAGTFWSTILLMSAVGTLATDALTDHFELPITTVLAGFAVALVVALVLWRAIEGNLSVKGIASPRREALWWLTVLISFALGTALQDGAVETMHLGYLKTALLFAAVIAVLTFAHRSLRLNGVISFWGSFLLTR